MRIAALASRTFVALGFATAAQAVEISEPWVRATPPGSTVAAGFLSLRGDPEQADRLLGASSPQAGSVEIHQTSMGGGVMRMRALPDGVQIDAGAQVSLEPGGIHLMLLDLPQALSAGGQVELLLRFERAGEVLVNAPILAPGQSPAPAAD